MIDRLLKKTYFKGAALLLWLTLVGGELLNYSGAPFVYALFSLVFLLLLMDGLYRRGGVAYTFLVFFLWLGFWLKLVLHLWLHYAYLEPIGYFDGSPQSWDEALTVSAIAALGVLLAKELLGRCTKQGGGESREMNFYAPCWYPAVRLWLWCGVLILIIAIPVSNSLFGFAQVGLLPALILPWPLNGLYAWVMGFGLVALLCTLVYWDHSIGRGWGVGFVGVLLEAFLSSVSALSRALYIFHTLPYLIVLYSRRFSLANIAVRVKLLVISLWFFCWPLVLCG